MISYRVWGGAGVAGSLTLPDGMNMQALDPTNAGAVNTWLATRGLQRVQCRGVCPASAAELASKANGNGVAYVLVSHGASRFGGFSADSNYLGTSSGPAPGPWRTSIAILWRCAPQAQRFLHRHGFHGESGRLLR